MKQSISLVDGSHAQVDTCMLYDCLIFQTIVSITMYIPIHPTLNQNSLSNFRKSYQDYQHIDQNRLTRSSNIQE